MSDQFQWLVWSYEHDAWWAPGRCGYVSDWQRAGRYRYTEALKICEEANRYSKRINEEMVHSCNAEIFYERQQGPGRFKNSA